MKFIKKDRKHFFDRDTEFWDKLVKGLFISGLTIVFLAVLLKWLGYI